MFKLVGDNEYVYVYNGTHTILVSDYVLSVMNKRGPCNEYGKMCGLIYHLLGVVITINKINKYI